MENVNTLEAALGFGGGVAFMAGVMWTFVVLPLRKDRDEHKADAKESRKDLQDFQNRILRKAGYDV